MISIIVPVYNASSYIESCIKSVIVQEFQDWECIIIDDGSTDNSLSICNKISESDSRIRVYSQNNSGVSAARNTGIEKIKGEWLLFLDADDQLLPGSLVVLSKYLNATDPILFGFQMKNKAGCVNYIPRHLQTIDLDNKDDLKYVSFRVWQYLIPTRIIHDNNLKFSNQLKYGEDAELLSRLLFVTKKLNIIDEMIYQYNNANVSATTNISYMNRLQHLECSQICLSHNENVLSCFIAAKLIERFILLSIRDNEEYTFLELYRKIIYEIKTYVPKFGISVINNLPTKEYYKAKYPFMTYFYLYRHR